MGVTVNRVTDGVSSVSSYNFDASASLVDEGRLGDGVCSHTSRLIASGDNEFSDLEYTAGSVASGSVRSTGSIVAAASTLASREGIIKSQSVDGTGDTAAALQGESGATTTEQISAVSDGVLSTSASLAAFKGFSISSQSMRMSGEDGLFMSGSSSPENSMGVSGYFNEKKGLTADLVSMAAGKASVYGTARASDGQGISGDLLEAISSKEDTGLSVKACYAADDGHIGEYSIEALNARTRSIPVRGPVIYKTFARLVNNAQVHLTLLTPTIPGYLDANSVAQEISKGANQWDSNTRQNLFKGSDSVNTPWSSNALEMSSSAPWATTKADGVWTEGWSPLEDGTIAVTYIWVSGTVRGNDRKYYSKIVDTDCWYNNNYQWRIASGESSTPTNEIFDIRTIATHELGHTVGLDDLYTSSASSQIMYGYNDGSVKWYLRSGDKAGLKSLYGA